MHVYSCFFILPLMHFFLTWELTTCPRIGSWVPIIKNLFLLSFWTWTDSWECMVYKQTIKDDKGMDSPLTAELLAVYRLPLSSSPATKSASRLIPTLVLWCMQSFSDELMMVKNQQRRTETFRTCCGQRCVALCVLEPQSFYGVGVI